MHRIAPCAPYLPRRASDTNKYDYGRVLIVGGCIGYTGAPTLCARAALRCGAGLVSVGVPEAIYAVTAVKNDEVMPFPLPSAEGKLARDALPVLLERLEKSDVCVLGPGLGRNDTLTALVQAVVMQSGTPLVLDADALFAVAQDAAVLERARAPIVLTPHDGEFARLAGPDKTGRAEAASDFAVRHGCTVVRKGPETVCAFPDGDAAVLRVGNPGMAKGGSGDVLAGMLGALLCQMPARRGADRRLAARPGGRSLRRAHGRICDEPDRCDRGPAGGHKTHHPIGGSMQRKAIAALMISLLLLSACGHGAGEQTFEAFRDTLTGQLVTTTAQVRVQRGDTVTDYTLTCQELPDGYDLTVTAPEQAAGVTAHLRDGASTLAFDDIILPAGDLNGAGLTPLTALPYVVQAIRSGYVDLTWTEDGLQVVQLITDDHTAVRLYLDGTVPQCAELSVDDTLCLRCTMENWNLEQGSMNDESQDPNLGRDQSQ